MLYLLTSEALMSCLLHLAEVFTFTHLDMQAEMNT